MNELVHSFDDPVKGKVRITFGEKQIVLSEMIGANWHDFAVFDADTFYLQRRSNVALGDETYDPPKNGLVRYSYKGQSDYIPSKELLRDHLDIAVGLLNRALDALQEQSPRRVAELRARLDAMVQEMNKTVAMDYRENPSHQPMDEKGEAFPGGPWLKHDELQSGRGGRKEFFAYGNLLAVAVSLGDYQAQTYLTANTKLNRDILISKGYKQVTSPGKDSHKFPNIRDKNFVQTLADSHNEDMSRFAEDIALIGHHNRVLPMPLAAGKLINVTGVTYAPAGKPGEIHKIEPVTKGELLGTYTVSPDGKMLSATDYEGNSYVGRADGRISDKPDAPTLTGWLEDNGFTRHDGMAIPFSRGETLIASDPEGKQTMNAAKAMQVRTLLSSLVESKRAAR